MKTATHFNILFRIIFLLLIAVMFSSCYKQKIVIDKVPLNTPEGTDIFITGNFNNWDPGDQKFRMSRQPDGTYSIALPRGVGKLDYKFTRGDWTRGERNECGYEIGNRTLIYGKNETVVNQIACWGDTEPMNCKQTVIVIKNHPANTPDDALIYLACQFNGWNPGNLKYILQKHPRGFYYLKIDRLGDCMDFKFTLGDWGTVETDGDNNDIDNRRYCFDGGDTLFLSVKEWKSINFRKISKVTFILDELPVQTKQGEQIYITGDFNNWNPGDPDYVFRYDVNGRPVITFSTDKELISYKITRGNWKSVEILPSGIDIPNRTCVCSEADTVFLKVGRWRDRF